MSLKRHSNTNSNCRVPSVQTKQTQLQLIFTVTGFGLATFLLCNHSAAIAQVSSPQGSETLFVNPTTGNDLSGNGSERTPFKTITKALQVAQPNNVIVLSSGTYSSASGETFPLILKPGISIQGDPYTKGRNIAIQGGGSFLSPTFARQDITILGANQSRLTGVTITNPHPRGYGLWLESSSPTVVENTFTGNTHDGISMTGSSAPTIRNNYFYQNGANGITIYGSSQPQVQENVFEKTGYGINISQQASPLLIGNRLNQNRSGIVAQANSRPILRGNVIENNTEDGVVAIASSQPDLGTPTQPGGNVFSQNGRYDVNSRASNQTISAFGNQLTSTRTIGSVNLTGTLSPVATTIPINPPLAQNPPSKSNSLASPAPSLPPTTDNATNPTPSRWVNSAKPASFPFLPPKQIAAQETPPSVSQPVAVGGPQSTELAPVIINVPPPELTTEVRQTPLSIPASASAINLPIPPSATTLAASSGQTLPVLKSAPIVQSELLPVPSSDIPIGRDTKQPKAVASSIPTPTRSAMPASIIALAPRYRVMVETPSESEQTLVRSLVPDAFLTSSRGKVLMQAGIYSDRANATEMLQLLNSNGLKATIEEGGQS